LRLRRPPLVPLFPYTTLFRSESVRRRLVSAYTGQLETAVEPSTDYPRLTLASRSTVITTRLAVDDLPSRSVHLEWLGRDDADLVDRKSTRLNSSHVKISYAVF